MNRSLLSEQEAFSSASLTMSIAKLTACTPKCVTSSGAPFVTRKNQATPRTCDEKNHLDEPSVVLGPLSLRPIGKNARTKGSPV